MSLRFVSYGGGVQSTALLVLAAQGRIDFRTFVMANVGDDSEMPATLRYVREVAMPYAAAHGIDLHLVDRVKRDGSVETLYGRLLNPIRCRLCSGTGEVTAIDTDRPELGQGRPRTCPRCVGLGETASRSLPIPVRMSNGAPGTRSCTADFKIKVTGKWAKAHGATKDNPAVVGIGISADEIHRANTRHVEPHEQIVYPLVGIGEDTGLSLNRQDCQNLIAKAGIPVPPKSSCFFCPFHRPETWDEMARTEPALFERAAALEDTLNERRRVLGKDDIFLTRFGKPLRVIANANQGVMDFGEDLDNCDSGWCMT